MLSLKIFQIESETEDNTNVLRMIYKIYNKKIIEFTESILSSSENLKKYNLFQSAKGNFNALNDVTSRQLYTTL